jgi:hypothetical protein
MENFDPEAAIRIAWRYMEYEGYFARASDDSMVPDEVFCVLASDYDKLLALYRALQPQMTFSERYGEIEIK